MCTVSITTVVKSCIDHSMHCATYHFIKSLHISSFMKTKRTAAEDENDDQPEDSDNNIDMSTNIKASSGGVAAMVSTAMTNFEPEDVLGKLLAFVCNLHSPTYSGNSGWIPEFHVDSGWILVGFWLDSGWILVGFWLDSGWIPEFWVNS